MCICIRPGWSRGMVGIATSTGMQFRVHQESVRCVSSGKWGFALLAFSRIHTGRPGLKHEPLGHTHPSTPTHPSTHTHTHPHTHPHTHTPGLAWRVLGSVDVTSECGLTGCVIKETVNSLFTFNLFLCFFVWVLGLYTLVTSYDHIRMGIKLWQCRLMAIL